MPHSSRILNLKILNSGYCRCKVSHVSLMSSWVSSGFSGVHVHLQKKEKRKKNLTDPRWKSKRMMWSIFLISQTSADCNSHKPHSNLLSVQMLDKELCIMLRLNLHTEFVHKDKCSNLLNQLWDPEVWWRI